MHGISGKRRVVAVFWEDRRSHLAQPLQQRRAPVSRVAVTRQLQCNLFKTLLTLSVDSFIQYSHCNKPALLLLQ